MRRAGDAGVVGFVVVGVGETLEQARQAVALARRIPDRVCACVGLHPHDASRWSESMHDELRELARAPEVVAVGEIGLDYHYDHSPREVQRDVFARLIGLAREVRKPIVVHARGRRGHAGHSGERRSARGRRNHPLL
jgi:TatD DNase family protein